MRRLAVFDLDNTLLAGDSDHLWGVFLVEMGVVDAQRFERENDRFYRAYQDGTLDIHEYAAFSLQVLVEEPLERMLALRRRYVEERIRPIIARGTPELLARHRAQGDTLMITTATGRFITEPIAELLGVDVLLATEPEVVEGRYTGRIAGTPNFQDGKVTRLQQWLAAQTQPYTELAGYSDSHNDLPLLNLMHQATAVDPDPTLRAAAEQRGWPVISLR